MSIEAAFDKDFFNRLDHTDQQSFENIFKKKVAFNHDNSPLESAVPIGSFVKAIKPINGYNVGQIYVVIDAHGDNRHITCGTGLGGFPGFKGSWATCDHFCLVTSFEDSVSSIEKQASLEEEEEEEEKE